MLWGILRRLTVVVTGLTLATGLFALTTPPAQAATFPVSITASATAKVGGKATVKSISPRRVPLAGGQRVTIAGTNLTGTTKVTVTPQVPASQTKDGRGKLPELPAAFEVLNARTLRVTPPASLGGKNLVKVYTPTGTLTITLTYARTSRNASTFEKAILDQVNLRRAKSQTCNGTSMPAVRSIAWDGSLSDLALSHARDLAARQSVYKGLDHVTYGLKEFKHRFFAAGFTTGSLGEDLALSPARYSATDVVALWMSSKSGHCESVMGKNWSKAGVGVASGSWNGQASNFINLDLRS